MGSLAAKSVEDTGLYGDLAVRYNTLRSFYKCVVGQVNTHKEVSSCIKSD